MESRVFERDLPDLDAVDALPAATGALMADPSAFDVEWVINPHMVPGSVDRAEARAQWAALKAHLEEAGLEVAVVPAAEGLCDLVFTANQSFPFRDGSRRVALGRMKASVRQPEVAVVAAAWDSLGFETVELPGSAVFEAGGDALWHPTRRVVLCGHGYRTERHGLDALADLLDTAVVALELRDERFYHLDTCLLPLDDRCALYVAEAFHDADRERILGLFPEAEAVPVAEAMRFACNGAVVEGRFLVQPGSPRAEAVARSRGLEVVEVHTGEFLKSGGSVTCLHMRF